MTALLATFDALVIIIAIRIFLRSDLFQAIRDALHEVRLSLRTRRRVLKNRKRVQQKRIV